MDPPSSIHESSSWNRHTTVSLLDRTFSIVKDTNSTPKKRNQAQLNKRNHEADGKKQKPEPPEQDGQPVSQTPLAWFLKQADLRWQCIEFFVEVKDASKLDGPQSAVSAAPKGSKLALQTSRDCAGGLACPLLGW